MNMKQAKIMENGQGFVAALDQSGGSTPKALASYGIASDQYENELEMFDLAHEMRARILTSPAFTAEHILAAILFEQTMNRKIEDLYTGDYLWEKKGIVPILKVDKGLDKEDNGVQLMKPITDLDSKLDRAIGRKMFGTKMRSVIKTANSAGIKKNVEQQFEYGNKILSRGLVPILEPEIDINSPDKAEAEGLLKMEIKRHLSMLASNEKIMLKLSIPEEDNFFYELTEHDQVMRVVALSGGYSREKAVKLLERHNGLIASFSRALAEGLNLDQSDKEFNAMLAKSIEEIHKASMT